MNSAQGAAPSATPGSSSGLSEGQTVGNGRFLLKKLLGVGGLGVVWQAHDLRLGEPVALKFLPPQIAHDPAALQDLRRETVRSRKLSHPNIVRIHDFFDPENEPPFISMELVDGADLHRLREARPLKVFPWSFLEPLVRQFCAALDYAHGEKIIHRDLKPANLMLDSTGRLKLADFGLARLAHDSMTRLTGATFPGGTLSFMSPQQADGRPPQPSDDIYSLGATLYDLLTSRPPFHQGDVSYQVRQVRPDPMPQRLADLELTNEIPSEVCALVMACLAKEPDQRPPSAKAILVFLDAAEEHRGAAAASFPVPSTSQIVAPSPVIPPLVPIPLPAPNPRAPGQFSVPGERTPKRGKPILFMLAGAFIALLLAICAVGAWMAYRYMAESRWSPPGPDGAEPDRTMTAMRPAQNPVRGALRFDRSNHVEVPSTPDLEFGDRPFTVSFWFRTSTAAPDFAFIVKRRSALQDGWSLHAHNKQLGFYAAGCSSPLSAMKEFRDGQWHHLAFVRQNSSVQIFFDSQLAGSGPESCHFNDSHPILVGTDAPPGHPFEGEIAEVRIYNRALSETEVAGDRARVEPLPDLIAGWHFDEGSGVTAKDFSGFGHQGKLINNPVWTGGRN